MSLYVCPCGNCDGETVEVEFSGGFAGTTCSVEPCSVLRAAGVTSYEVRRSAPAGWTPAGWLTPTDDGSRVVARGGLVTFG